MVSDIFKNLKNNLISIKTINYKKRKVLNCIIVFLMILILPSFFKIVFPYMDYTFIISIIFSIFYWNIVHEKKVSVLDEDLFSYLEIGINKEEFFKDIDFKYNPLDLKDIKNIENNPTLVEDLNKYESIFQSIINKVSIIEKKKNIKLYKVLLVVVLSGILSVSYFKMDFIYLLKDYIFQTVDVNIEVKDVKEFYSQDSNIDDGSSGNKVLSTVNTDENIEDTTKNNEANDRVSIRSYTLNRFFTKKILVSPKSIVKIMVRNSFSTRYKKAYSIELLNSDGSIFQVFSPYYNSSSTYQELEISLSKNQYLRIPEISSRKLALFITNNEDLPKVVASIDNIENIDSEIIEDDKELNIDINVESKISLNKIYLEIRSSKTNQEMVTQILNKKTFKYNTQYPLLLDRYLEEDIEDFEIVAIAEDNSTPTPLIGESDPIHIKVASAYGIYRSSLEKIKVVKNLLEEWINTNKASSKPLTLMKEVKKISSNLSFFDFWDRDRISSIVDQLESQPKDISKLYDILEDINSFLFEHETLDFRERDRDFFVAIRTLSKMIKEKKGKELDNAFFRLSSFLDERFIIWEQRVKRIESILNKTPSLWKGISKKSLNKKLDDIKNIENISNNPKTEEQISSLTISYRTWIEELEKYEDEALKVQEDKKEQAMSSLKEELKRIQRQQSEISKDLNDADKNERVEEIKDNFPSIRLKQNSNIEDSKSFKLKIAPFVPKAKNRLDLAIEAMEEVVKEGEKSNFIVAESQSDLANRLLRQTESDTKNNRRRSTSSRSRRKLINDKYYGSSIINQDVKIIHQYNVEGKYRNDILEDIEKKLQDSKDLDQKHEKYLKKYLKEVIK